MRSLNILSTLALLALASAIPIRSYVPTDDDHEVIEVPPNLFNKTFDIDLTNGNRTVPLPVINSTEDQISTLALDELYDERTIYEVYDLTDLGLIEYRDDEPREVLVDVVNNDDYEYRNFRVYDPSYDTAIVRVAILDEVNQDFVGDGRITKIEDEEGTIVAMGQGTDLEEQLLSVDGWSRIDIPQDGPYVHANYLLVHNVTLFDSRNVLDRIDASNP